MLSKCVFKYKKQDDFVYLRHTQTYLFNYFIFICLQMWLVLYTKLHFLSCRYKTHNLLFDLVLPEPLSGTLISTMGICSRLLGLGRKHLP